jgi:hypothetical protein
MYVYKEQEQSRRELLKKSFFFFLSFSLFGQPIFKFLFIKKWSYSQVCCFVKCHEFFYTLSCCVEIQCFFLYCKNKHIYLYCMLFLQLALCLHLHPMQASICVNINIYVSAIAFYCSDRSIYSHVC